MILVEIIRPTMVKLAAGLGLFGAAYVIHQWWTRNIMDYTAYGWPFAFREAWGPCPPGEVCRAFHAGALLGDLVLWYVVGAVLVFLLQRRRTIS